MSRAVQLLEEENAALRAQLNVIRRTIIEMDNLVIEMHPDDLKKSGYYEKGDEKAPFFSESLLYNLLGKDDARTLLAYFHGVQRAAGPDAPEARVYLKLQKLLEKAPSYYGTEAIRKLLPEKPECPRLEESVYPPAYQVPRKLRTPKQQKEVDEFYESKVYRTYSKAYQKYRDDPVVQAWEELEKMQVFERDLRDIEKEVRETETNAEVRTWRRSRLDPDADSE